MFFQECRPDALLLNVLSRLLPQPLNHAGAVSRGANIAIPQIIALHELEEIVWDAAADERVGIESPVPFEMPQGGLKINHAGKESAHMTVAEAEFGMQHIVWK